MSRADRVRQAQALRGEGLLLREIAEHMGAAVATISAYLRDPDGSKLRARKDSYRGECVDCGRPTDGTNGRDRAPKRCSACSIAYQTVWSRESIVAAIQRWAGLYGEPPGEADWTPGHPSAKRRPWRTERYRSGHYPNSSTIDNYFGSWNAAIEAAGFEPRVRSSGACGIRHPERDPLKAVAA